MVPSTVRESSLVRVSFWSTASTSMSWRMVWVLLPSLTRMVDSTSTLLLGRTKPPASDSALTRMATARMPGGSVAARPSFLASTRSSAVTKLSSARARLLRRSLRSLTLRMAFFGMADTGSSFSTKYF